MIDITGYDKNTLVVYWSPAPFLPCIESWTYLYTDPVPVLKTLNLVSPEKNRSMIECPAFIDRLKKVFCFKSNIADSFDLVPAELINLNNSEDYPLHLTTNSIVGVQKIRNSSIKNHINLQYNMSWLFFTEENVLAKMTSPYFPPATPVQNGLLSPGQYFLGNWFRGFPLDYHIPLSSTRFEIKKDDPLFYLELETDKKIVFKRFLNTKLLKNIADELSNSTSNYGSNKDFFNRYENSKKALIKNIILKEIKENILY
jgi:hypothetical protein